MVNFSKIIIFNLVTLMALNSNHTAMNKSINENAPVIEKQQIFIPVKPEIVWEVISNINQWPNWQSDVTQAEVLGEMEAGTTFKWKAGGIRFTSELHTVEKNQAIGWTGRTFGAQAIHNWCFEAREEGTMVYVEESLQGLFPSLFKRKFSKSLKEGMKKNLKELYSTCINRNSSGNVNTK